MHRRALRIARRADPCSSTVRGIPQSAFAVRAGLSPTAPIPPASDPSIGRRHITADMVATADMAAIVAGAIGNAAGRTDCQPVCNIQPYHRHTAAAARCNSSDKRVDPQITQIFTDSPEHRFDLDCVNLRNLWINFFYPRFFSGRSTGKLRAALRATASVNSMYRTPVAKSV